MGEGVLVLVLVPVLVNSRPVGTVSVMHAEACACVDWGGRSGLGREGKGRAGPAVMCLWCRERRSKPSVKVCDIPRSRQ